MLVLEADRARMSQIDSQIRDLWKERKLLRERFDGYKYPVLTLPNEIVSEIFSRFLPVYPLRPPAIDLLYPTILGQICRKWRQIALSTPVLWRAIALTFPEDDPPEPRIQLLATWLNRSGSFPLSIKVDDQFKVTKQNQLVRTIVPHCARWEYLALTLPMADLLFIKGHMPLLRGFETWHLMLPLIALPWTQLTTLIVSNVEQDRCADILKHAFNSGQHKTPPPPQSPGVIARLRQGPAGGPGGVAPCLDPASSSPAPDPRGILALDPINALSSFIARSGCSLEELCMTASTLPNDVYRTAFPSIPTLEFPDRHEDGEAEDDEDSRDSEDSYGSEDSEDDDVEEYDSDDERSSHDGIHPFQTHFKFPVSVAPTIRLLNLYAVKMAVNLSIQAPGFQAPKLRYLDTAVREQMGPRSSSSAWSNYDCHAEAVW
ncbi:hypothetical protein C8R44DRAFT_733283 [Mycena epipterygia]|nr:hypothetical protein C8R44DRAFT_733283 [Mycena epipterygia]